MMIFCFRRTDNHSGSQRKSYCCCFRYRRKRSCRIVQNPSAGCTSYGYSNERKSGLDASAEILEEFPDAKILLLTTFSDDEYIVKALKLGAKGYLLKQDYASILPALEAVCSGQTVFGTEIMSRIPELIHSGSSFHYEDYDISRRELEIIRLIADGLSNKEIASQLF